jgi:hypothetical protein
MSGAAIRKRMRPADKAGKHQDSYLMMPFMQRCSENERDAVNRANQLLTRRTDHMSGFLEIVSIFVELVSVAELMQVTERARRDRTVTMPFPLG